MSIEQRILIGTVVGTWAILALIALVQEWKATRKAMNSFKQDRPPSGVLTAPGAIDDATAARLEAEWKKAKR